MPKYDSDDEIDSCVLVGTPLTSLIPGKKKTIKIRKLRTHYNQVFFILFSRRCKVYKQTKTT